MRSIAESIERVITIIGRLSSWSMAVLLIAIVTQVTLRYAYGITNTALEDSLWYLFAMSMVLGLSYTMTVDGHVRVDFVYQKYSDKMKRMVDLLGIVFFLIPLYAFLLWHGWDFTVKAFLRGESSPNPGGMPWLWLVKGLLPLSCLLLLVEAVARAILIATNKRRKDGSKRHGS